MASIYDTKKLVNEIYAVLKANTDLEKVSLGALISLSQETAKTAVYVSIDSVAVEPNIPSTGLNAYDRHLLVSLHCNINTDNDATFIYDVVDSIERCILKDNDLWESLVDRDLVAINFDNQEHSPKRSVALLFDIRYRLQCE